MGSWNEQCAVSGLPICYGDPIVGVVVRKRTDKVYDGYFDPFALYEPVTLTVRGRYDSYGRVDDVPDIHWQEFIKSIPADVVEIIEKQQMKGDDFREDYGIGMNRVHSMEVGWFYMHADIWDHVIPNLGYEDKLGNILVKRVQAINKAVREFAASDNKLYYFDVENQLAKHEVYLYGLEHSKTKRVLSAFVTGEKPLEELDDFLELFAVQDKLRHALDMLRVRLVPGFGGTQTSYDRSIKSITNFRRDYMQRRDDLLGEEDEEDDE